MTYKIPQYQPQFVYDKDSYDELEKQLDELNAELNVREIEVTFTGERLLFGNVTSSHDAFQFIRDTILKGIEVQEHFVALYLSQANKIIGYYHHSTGTINSTPVDIEIVAAVALKTLAKAIIISHNHHLDFHPLLPSLSCSPGDYGLRRNCLCTSVHCSGVLVHPRTWQ